MYEHRTEKTESIKIPVEAILEIFKQQNEIIRLISSVYIYVPGSSGIDLEDCEK